MTLPASAHRSLVSEPDPVVGPVPAPHQVRQRRVRRGWVAAGVLLMVLSALGSATLFRAMGPSQEFLAVAVDVPVGAQITSADLMVVRLHDAPGLSTMSADEAEAVLGRYAAVPLLAGSLVIPEQVTPQRVPAPGDQLLPLSLSRDELPAGLDAGDPVLLVATGGASSSDQPETFSASVHAIEAASGRAANMVVSLVVAEEHGPAIAGLAATGQVAVLRVTEPEP